MLPGREVAKGVKMRRVRTVIVAPNIEQIETEGGLDDLLANILQQAEAAGIPVVFALSRKKLGQVHPSFRPIFWLGFLVLVNRLTQPTAMCPAYAPHITACLHDAAVEVTGSLSTGPVPQVFGCRKKMSAIAVLNPSGAEALYSRMHTLAAEGRQEHARINGEVTAHPTLSRAPALSLTPPHSTCMPEVLLNSPSRLA